MRQEGQVKYFGSNFIRMLAHYPPMFFGEEFTISCIFNLSTDLLAPVERVARVPATRGASPRG